MTELIDLQARVHELEIEHENKRLREALEHVVRWHRLGDGTIPDPIMDICCQVLQMHNCEPE